MNATSSIALSGMSAARAGLDSAAHNIANASTPNFRRQEVQQSETAGGGVEATFSRASEAGASLETDTVGLLESKNAFLANLAVFKTSDRMLGSALDALA